MLATTQKVASTTRMAVAHPRAAAVSRPRRFLVSSSDRSGATSARRRASSFSGEPPGDGAARTATTPSQLTLLCSPIALTPVVSSRTSVHRTVSAYSTTVSSAIISNDQIG